MRCSKRLVRCGKSGSQDDPNGGCLSWTKMLEEACKTLEAYGSHGGFIARHWSTGKARIDKKYKNKVKYELNKSMETIKYRSCQGRY
jgi:hypothetical protein